MLQYFKLLSNKEVFERIIVRKREILQDEIGFEALAYLNEDLLKYKPHYEIHSNAAGMGSSSNKVVALMKSISEALERWAYSQTKGDNNLGYDIINDSSGFSAYPNILRNIARRNSIQEAFERWALLSFWNGDIKLTYSEESKTAIYFDNELGLYFTIVFDKQDSKYIYGFSASHNLKDAIYSSRIECYRNFKTIKSLSKMEYEIDKLHLGERRLLHFASPEGFQSVMNKIQKSPSKNKTANLVLCQEVKGPWSKYTNVYRSVFDCPDIAHSDHVNIFKF